LRSAISKMGVDRRTYSNYTETGVLQLRVGSCGTAFKLNCDKLTLAFNDLSGY